MIVGDFLKIDLDLWLLLRLILVKVVIQLLHRLVLF